MYWNVSKLQPRMLMFHQHCHEVCGNWGIVAGIALDPVVFLITFPMKQAKEIGLDLNVFFSICFSNKKTERNWGIRYTYPFEGQTYLEK